MLLFNSQRSTSEDELAESHVERAAISRPASTWICSGCNEEMIGVPPTKGSCYACQQHQSLFFSKQKLNRRSVDKVPLEHRKNIKRHELLAACGFPTDYWSGFDPSRLSGGWPVDKRHPETSLTSWVGQPPHHAVCLSGPVGVGKTFLAVQLAYQAWLSGASIGYVMAGEIAPLRWQQRDQHLLRLGVLVIDDLDRGPSGAAWKPTFELIHSRLSRHLAIVTTINVTPLVLFEMNSAVSDRLRGGLILSMDGGSRR